MIMRATKPGKELERRVADAYREMGAWKVEHDVELAGNQIDVYVELEAPGHILHRIAVEAKDWTSPVGIDIVNKFAIIVNLLRGKGLIDEGIIVSAAGFSKQARNAAQTYGIRLLEEADLGAMVAEAKAAKAEETGVKEERPVQPLAQVTLLLDGINSFGTSEREYLVGVLAEALRLEREQIRVLRVESGSVRVTLELPAEAAASLARMIESGELDLTSVFQKWAASKYQITITDSQGVVIGDHAQVIQRFDIPLAGQGESGPSVAEERASLERQLAQHKRNLYRLREQEAIYATGEVPLHLLNQIEEEEREIQGIEQRLAELAEVPVFSPTAQAILTKYNGKRVMPNKPNEPPQYFLYKGKPCHLSQKAAELLDDKKIKIERLESEEWSILDRLDKGAPIGSWEEMEDILKEVHPELFPATQPQPDVPSGALEYERGLSRLRDLLTDRAPALLSEFHTLEARLLDNMRAERLYGTTETVRAERAQVVDVLNDLARRAGLGSSFNDLCRE